MRMGARKAQFAGRKIVFALAGAILASVTFGNEGWAQASDLDAAILGIERPETLLEALQQFPDMLAAQGGAGQQPDALLSAARTAANEAFAPEPIVEDLKSALGQVSGEVEGVDLETLADHFADAASKQEQRIADAGADPASDEARALAEQLDQEFEARADKEQIEELETLMATGTLSGEARFASRVVYDALREMPDETVLKELAAKSDDELAEEAGRLADESFAREMDPTDPMSREFGELEGRIWLRNILIALSAEDVASLHGFYTSDIGKAKRDALVEAFAARLKESTIAMLSQYLVAVKKTAQ